MKKLPFALGAVVGFLAGSRSGRGPYMKLEEKVREIAGRPDVRKVAEEASDTIQQKIHDVQSTAAQKIHHLKDERAS